VQFMTMHDINQLRSDQGHSKALGGGGFDLVRSSLGLVKQKEDWIFNMSIANVMMLNMMEVNELKISMNSNTNNKLGAYNEVARDSMLEKIVLISVAYFCRATEMRFLAKSNIKQNLEETE
jgi:hypothetical protein